MKRLWKTIPPCLSDVLGFEAVINQTDGLGIIDDSSRYKPLRLGENREFGRPHDGGHPGKHGGYPGRHGGFGGRGRGDVRVVNSDIRDADIIHGTQEKVLQAFRNRGESRPGFVLLSYAPSSSMIGSDLDTAAEMIGQESGLPAACVNLHGDKDYLYGISITLEAMGKLLLEKQPAIPGTVNLLGCNAVDWHKDTLAGVEEMLNRDGFTVLSRWGCKETTENLKKASAASVNWVVNVSGIRLARYMEAQFGIPYIVGAPFGREQSKALLRSLRNPQAQGCAERSGSEAPEVLVISEQLTANAVRQALLQRGFRNIRVLSFYDMEKTCMMDGDGKVISEEDLADRIRQASVQLVLADPDYKMAAGREVSWIALPNLANQSPVNGVANFNMAGDALDEWLDGALANRRRK